MRILGGDVGTDLEQACSAPLGSDRDRIGMKVEGAPSYIDKGLELAN